MLHQATGDDVPALVALLAESVAAWWGENSADDVRQALPFS